MLEDDAEEANNETTWRCRYRYRRANSPYADVADKSLLLRKKATSKPYGMVGAMRDITMSGIDLAVSDNDMGINPDKDRSDVFGLYKRFHPHIEIKGIGLLLAKTEIEKLGGALEVKSKVNRGTTFKIFLPSINF